MQPQSILTCDTKITFFMQLNLDYVSLPVAIGLTHSLVTGKLLYKLKVHQWDLIQIGTNPIYAKSTSSFCFS